MIGKRKLIGNINDIAPYTVLHNSMNVLRRGLTSLNVVEEVCFIGEETKSNACSSFEIMRESINPALHISVIIECVTVKVAKLRSVLL